MWRRFARHPASSATLLSVTSDETGTRPRTNSRARAEVPPGLDVPNVERRIGRYEVEKIIGKGAMGVVYQARDPLLDRVVAVKTIVAPGGQSKKWRASYLERFQREAKAAAKMQHPSIVTIFDVGVDETTGAPFMVLEYLPGDSLADRLDKCRIPLQHCVQIGLDLASALGFAHKLRIVHRDVKPANVLHAGENRWKLADFGIARLPDSDLTQAGIFMGTPGYSPPEAIREGRYTPGADVFAWGAVLYELLSGRIAYEGPDTKTTNGYVVKGQAPPPTHYDPSIPDELSRITMRALAPAAADRFKDGVEAEEALRKAWENCLTSGAVHASVLAGEPVPHDRAPAQMHRPRGAAGAVRASIPPAPPPSMPPAPAFLEEQKTVVQTSGAVPDAARPDVSRSSKAASIHPPRNHGVSGGPVRPTPPQILPINKAHAPSWLPWVIVGGVALVAALIGYLLA